MYVHCPEGITAWAEEHKSCLVAFSGGLDSTLLLALLHRETNISVTALTVRAPYTPPWEIEEASAFCKSEGIDHIILDVDIAPEIRNNPENRCYLCKRNLFTMILQQAEMRNIEVVADGTNADDNPAERPGMRALAELAVESPLRDAGLGKAQIRSLSRELSLPTAEKASCSCMMTRFPHGHTVSFEELILIAKAERYLHEHLTDNIRIRPRKRTCRVEIGGGRLADVLALDKLREDITEYLKGLGLKHITFAER